MEIDAHLLEMLPVLVILVGAAVIVGFGIHVGQRLERRSDSARSAVANERLAGADERADVCPSGRVADEDAVRDVDRDSALLVMDDGDAPAIIAPWRAATGRDSEETADRPVASARGWSRQESDDIVELYRSGFELDEVAADLHVTSSSVVEELARRAFGAMDPVADPRARRFGQRWTVAELRTLHSASRAGFGVADIARQLGRDQLSTVFRLLEAAADARVLRGRLRVGASRDERAKAVKVDLAVAAMSGAESSDVELSDAESSDVETVDVATSGAGSSTAESPVRSREVAFQG